MALEIKAAGDTKLIISGTNTELTDVYARIEFALPKTGASMQGALYCYIDKAKYEADSGSLLRLENFATNYPIEIDIVTETQSLQTGHNKIKASLEALGYTVTIKDLS